jgi:HAMP domain-containing protein
MRLLVKFNLVLLIVFGIGFLATGYVSKKLLQRNAKEEIAENARIMMEAALAVRWYTANQVGPLLATQIKYSFVPQIVPGYSANQYFSQLHKKFQDYSYKEATLNPTNPINRADDWESDIVRYFRNTPTQTELIGERDTPNGRVMYLARPMAILPSCLQCHDTPERAPRTMLDRYGSANGFGWKAGEIQTAQIVSAPMQLPLQRASHVFRVFMTSLAAIFAVLLASLNAMVIVLVTWPVNQLAKIADKVSLGNLDVPDFQPSGHDEIAKLAESFRRMRRSMVKAIKMLEV